MVPMETLTRRHKALLLVRCTGNTRPILDLKIATVARDVARLCATFRDFPRLWFATLRDFIKILAIDRKSLIRMTSHFFVLRPSATFRGFLRL
jgi:predicted transcriptional regulator